MLKIGIVLAKFDINGNSFFPIHSMDRYTLVNLKMKMKSIPLEFEHTVQQVFPDKEGFGGGYLSGSNILLLLPVAVTWTGQRLGQIMTLGFTAENHYPERLTFEQSQCILAAAVDKKLILFDAPSAWPIFRKREIMLTERLEFSKKKTMPEVQLTVSDALAVHFDKLAKYLAECQSSFDVAERYLSEHLHSDAYYASEQAMLRSAAQTVVSCMEASGDPMLRAWNDEKASDLQRAVEEVIRRKDMQRHGFKMAAETIRTVVSHATFPTYWVERPHVPLFPPDKG